MTSESIPLVRQPTGPQSFVTEVEVIIDGHRKMFLLDTGAAASSLAIDEHTKNYPSLGKKDAKGAAGKATSCDIVQPKKASIGSVVFENPRFQRCKTNILGLDFLGRSSFEVDLVGLSLVLKKHPVDSLQHQVRRLSPGHVTIPLKVQDQVIDALFDTGADTTVIDSQFVEENKRHFELVRSEEGTDAHGHKIRSNVYLCRSVQVGKLHLRNVEMAAFDFGEFLRGKMEGSPMILGNNVISRAKWYFDLTSGKWQNEILNDGQF